MTQKKTHWLRTSIVIMLIFAIAGLALTVVQFMHSSTPTAATATIEFTFEGAADGIAPNGTMFSVSDINSEDVLGEALKACALDDTYTVEQLQQCLVIRGVYPANMVEQVKSYISLLDTSSNHEVSINDYHATTYTIELYDDFDNNISREQLETLLKAIVSAYKKNFAIVYANGLNKVDLTTVLTDYDYLQQADFIDTYFSTMATYAQEMYTRRPAFLHEGKGFNDITVRLNTLIGNDLVRIKAEATMNALSRTPIQLENNYRFQINALENQMDSQKSYLAQLDRLIETYEKNSIVYVSSGQNVTKIDDNTNVTYDILTGQHKTVSEIITTLNAEIVNYQQSLADLTGENTDSDLQDAFEADEAAATVVVENVANQAEIAEAGRSALEKSIQAIVEKGSTCIDDFEDLLKVFNDEEINDQTVAVTKYSYKMPKILSGAFITAAIKTAGPFCAIGFMLCMLLIIRSRKKEARQADLQQTV